MLINIGIPIELFLVDLNTINKLVHTTKPRQGGIGSIENWPIIKKDKILRFTPNFFLNFSSNFLCK